MGVAVKFNLPFFSGGGVFFLGGFVEIFLKKKIFPRGRGGFVVSVGGGFGKKREGEGFF